MYLHADKVLRDLGHVSPRSCPTLYKNTLQAKAVYNGSSASYGIILLQYLTACRLEFGLMPTVKGVFSLFASLENNRKSLCKFLLDSFSAVIFDHTSSEAVNKIFVYIFQFVFKVTYF